MPIKPAPTEPSKRELKKVIEAGSPPVPAEKTQLEKEVNFPMKITGDIVDIFEEARKEASLSRRSWVMLAIIEKLKKDGNL